MSAMAGIVDEAAHIAVSVDTTGINSFLGTWVQAREGTAFRATVCAELASRSVKDVLVVMRRAGRLAQRSP